MPTPVRYSSTVIYWRCLSRHGILHHLNGSTLRKRWYQLLWYTINRYVPVKWYTSFDALSLDHESLGYSYCQAQPTGNHMLPVRCCCFLKGVTRAFLLVVTWFKPFAMCPESEMVTLFASTGVDDAFTKNELSVADIGLVRTKVADTSSSISSPGSSAYGRYGEERSREKRGERRPEEAAREGEEEKESLLVARGS